MISQYSALERHGISRGDILLRIDGIDPTGMSLSDVEDILVGAKGTKVSSLNLKISLFKASSHLLRNLWFSTNIFFIAGIGHPLNFIGTCNYCDFGKIRLRCSCRKPVAWPI